MMKYLNLQKSQYLKKHSLELTGDIQCKKSENMGEILDPEIDDIIRNYKNENPFLK